MTMRRLFLLLLAVLVSIAPLAAAEHPQVVVLVRHGEKSDAPPGDVALSDTGRARAEELAIALAEARLDTIITTQFRRTRETAAPLARELKLNTVIVQAGDDTPSHARAVAAAVRAGGRSVLVVGHSNTVPAIIGALGGPAMDELCDSEYSNLFTLVLVPGEPVRLVHGHYGAPDSPVSAECRGKMKQ